MLLGHTFSSWMTAVMWVAVLAAAAGSRNVAALRARYAAWTVAAFSSPLYSTLVVWLLVG